ncbi:MAG: IS200/IS605 family transposase [Saprospiraceae bacterium]
MANTYTQIHIQVVIVVKYRQAIIDPIWKEKLYKYMTGIIQGADHKLLAINGMPDHVHILFGMRPTQALSKLMQEVKRDSAAWINDHALTEKRFRWQGGFGAFSYTKDLVPRVIRYIQNQEEHHQALTMRQEYRKLLKAAGVDYKEEYIFQELI